MRLVFHRCRGRKYATEFGACKRAARLHTSWFHCARCGHWHVATRSVLRRQVAA